MMEWLQVSSELTLGGIGLIILIYAIKGTRWIGVRVLDDDGLIEKVAKAHNQTLKDYNKTLRDFVDASTLSRIQMNGMEQSIKGMREDVMELKVAVKAIKENDMPHLERRLTEQIGELKEETVKHRERLEHLGKRFATVEKRLEK